MVEIHICGGGLLSFEGCVVKRTARDRIDASENSREGAVITSDGASELLDVMKFPLGALRDAELAHGALGKGVKVSRRVGEVPPGTPVGGVRVGVEVEGEPVVGCGGVVPPRQFNQLLFASRCKEDEPPAGAKSVARLDRDPRWK